MLSFTLSCVQYADYQICSTSQYIRVPNKTVILRLDRRIRDRDSRLRGNDKGVLLGAL